MRARGYYFIMFLFGFGGLVATLMTGEIGYLLYGLFFSQLFMAGFAFTCQVRLYSPKLISDRLSVSIGPDPKWATLPAIGRHGAGAAWEESWAIPLGGGRWGVFVVPGLREYGVLIVAKRLLYEINGQYIVWGHTIPLRAHHRSLVEAMRRIKPIGNDSRSIIPQEWLRIMTQHDHWRASSPIFIAQDPAHAVILPGDPKKPAITLKNYGDIPLRDLSFIDPKNNQPVILKNVLPVDSPVLDLRAEMDLQLSANLIAARKELGEQQKRDLIEIEHLEAQVTRIKNVNDQVDGVGFLGLPYIDEALGPDDTAQRRT